MVSTALFIAFTLNAKRLTLEFIIVQSFINSLLGIIIQLFLIPCIVKASSTRNNNNWIRVEVMIEMNVNSLCVLYRKIEQLMKESDSVFKFSGYYWSQRPGECEPVKTLKFG
mgnify:CR=1 FL=1